MKRRGGLLTFWRRSSPEVVEVVDEEVEEDELDPEVEANQRLRTSSRRSCARRSRRKRRSTAA